MSVTWHSEVPAEPVRPAGVGAWARVVLRGVPILLVLGFGLVLKLLLRLAEAPLCGAARPVTPWITVVACRAVLWLLGIGWRMEGRPDPTARLLAANHVSWLDIFVLNAVQPLYFVAKAEVAGWPGIGWLARATGTVFITRDPRQAALQAALLRSRLAAGHRLVLFAEGTSTDGRRVLRFRAPLFAAADLGGPGLLIQPVALAYHAPAGADPRFYGWWGDMEMGPHLLQVLAAAPQGRVVVHPLPVLAADAMRDRKALAETAEAAVRRALDAELGLTEPTA